VRAAGEDAERRPFAICTGRIVGPGFENARAPKGSRYGGHEFSIGGPYPDRNPEHLTGGFLYVNEETFESATLTTFDGNDYFAISIKTRCMEILVQDGDSTYP
jgi:hypothetical protein